MATVDVVSGRESFKSRLADLGLRVTSQRMAIFHAARQSDEHFTAEELLEYSRRFDHTVSRATVYRTLPILTESRVVREVDIGKNYKFYCPSREEEPSQAQVICTDCDKIFEMDAPFLEWYGQSVATKLGLSVEDQRLQVSASCERLKTNGCCENCANDERSA